MGERTNLLAFLKNLRSNDRLSFPDYTAGVEDGLLELDHEGLRAIIGLLDRPAIDQPRELNRLGYAHFAKPEVGLSRDLRVLARQDWAQLT